VRAAILAAGLLALTAGAASGGERAGGAVTITVTAGKPSEYGFRLSRSTIAPGPVVFKVVNRGKVGHDFAIAGKRTRVLSPGQTANLTVRLTKARDYAYASSVRGQAAHGMRGVVTVRVVKSAAPAAPAPAPVAQTPGAQGSATKLGTPCASPASSTVNVRMFDFGFTLTPTTVPCGSVTFVLVNSGQVAHNFDVETPTNGRAAFNGGTTLLGGESGSQALTYSITGTFRYQCDLHVSQGQMVGTLTVT
jgi:plastocyanin